MGANERVLRQVFRVGQASCPAEQEMDQRHLQPPDQLLDARR
jgi:hypothetical protein